MKVLNQAIDYLQAKFPPNRVVVLLTPLVLAPAAGWVATYVAQLIPSVQLDPTQVTAIFLGGALAAISAGYKWLDGWQKHEEKMTLFYSRGLVDPKNLPSEVKGVPVDGDPANVVRSKP